tara:strand:+ start:2908 stop:4278 length:1371 start_codon:yes stop_codon:yes gene_type:complete
MNRKYFIISYIICFVPSAFAYFEPGTGSILISSIISLFATSLFYIKDICYKIQAYRARWSGQQAERKHHGLAFYCEGPQYWNTFKPILESLDQRGIEATYLTSSLDDMGLKFESKFVTCQYIGQSTKAYAYLQMLEADVLAMTTPGFDVLQIKRSKRVKHYAYIQHAPTTGVYNTYSFDYFDSILCSGPHQIKALRTLEQKRGLPPKKILESGCPYFDVLMDQKKDIFTSSSKIHQHEQTRILIAPTWDTNGLLHRFGVDLIEPLARQGYDITIRPHPQSLIVEVEMINSLKQTLQKYHNIKWDENPSAFETLAQSDIMISDMSGIIFDYAFIFEKPVITMKFDIDLSGSDANDLSEPLWELQALDQIGRQVSLDELDKLSEITENLSQDQGIKDRIRAIRDNSVFYYGKSGSVIANQLLNIRNKLTQPSQEHLESASYSFEERDHVLNDKVEASK